MLQNKCKEKSETREVNDNKTNESQCLICGADKATLCIQSKALSPQNKAPFFPFLATEDSVSNDEDNNSQRGYLDGNGQGLVCSVCHSFLIQQWNSYEASQTPIAKRVYWLKRTNSKMSEDYMFNERFMQQTQFNVTVKTEDAESCSTNSDTVSNVDKSETSSEINSVSRMSRCGACNQSLPNIESCQVIHTRPQINLGTPFFPSLISLATQEDIDKQGKMIICILCYDFLNYQWLQWEKSRAPVQGRTYSIRWCPTKTKQLCPLCKDCFSSDDGMLLNIIPTSDQSVPYYPFIRNYLEVIPGWSTSANDKAILVCLPCSNILNEQWKEFEDEHKPHEERVYLSGTLSFNNDKTNICFCCKEQMNYSKSKVISTSLRSNIFYSKIKINDSVECEGANLFKVCCDCARQLNSLYKRFDKYSIPRALRCYVITNDIFECYIGCFLCETMMVPENAQWIDIYRQSSESKSDIKKPYFPCFSRHALPYTRLIGCSLCYSNICAQWDAYEQDETLCVASCVVPPHKRKYVVDQFVCYGCGKKKSRNFVGAVDLNCYPSLIKTVKPPGSIHVSKYAVICLECQQKARTNEGINRKTNPAQRSSTLHEIPTGIASGLCRASSSVTWCETSVVMKATATVQPLKTSSQTVNSHSPGLSLSSRMSSHHQSTDHVTQNGGDEASEGSFAAALRKLAREALASPGEAASVVSSGKERKAMLSSGSRSVSSHMPPAPPVGFHTGIHHPGAPRSRDLERSEMSLTFADSENQSRRLSQQQQQLQQQQQDHQKMSSSSGLSRNRSAPYPPREDHQTKESNSNAPLRDNSECDRMRSRHGPFSHVPHKERTASNVGLVHPQRARKLPSDENKSTVSPIISHHHRESQHNPTTFFRPHSPEERRYPSLAPTLSNSHGSGSSCPVHGAETTHSRRGSSPSEHNERIPPRLPFDPMVGMSRHQHSPSSSMADIRSASIQHHRIQDELYALSRHPAEVMGRTRESYPGHTMDEEFRRRNGFEWPWNATPSSMPHPYYDAEQYRRHVVASMRGHDHHLYKDPSSTQIMLGHPHYIPRDYPPPHSVDPYIHSGMHPSEYYPHRHEHPLPPTVSPRLMDYYRHHEQQHYERARDYLLGEGLNERLASHHSHASDRNSLAPGMEESSSKRGSDHISAAAPPSTVDVKPSLLQDGRSESAQMHRRVDRHMRTQKTDHVAPVDHNEKDAYLHTLGLVSHQMQYRRNSRPSLLPPTSKSLVTHGSLLENSHTQPVGSRVEGLPETPSPVVNQDENNMQSDDGLIRSEDSEFEDISMNDCDDQKHKFMMSLGLVTHSKHKVLEEDYDMKRWERKMRKYRGRPRKKLKKEVSEDSGDHRVSADIDFYSGPITRHKQQLLQEQENLMGQANQNDKEGSNCQEDSNRDVAMDTTSSNGNDTSLHPSIKHRPHIDEQPHYETRRTMTNGFHQRLVQQNKKGPRPPKAKMPRLVDVEESQSHSVDIGKGINSHITWPGIDIIAESYATYKQGLEREEESLKRGRDDLRTVEEELSLQSDVIKREMMMLHDRKLQVGETLQRSRRDIDRIHEMLRALTST